MKNCGKLLGVLAILGWFSFGCAMAPKDASKEIWKENMTRCPKCAVFFSSKEGAETFEYMKPR
jgi:hypothetical protein